MKRFVVALAFNSAATQVVLIRKAKPVWMAGKLNGVGGKLEAGETPLQAMIREFSEETGVHTPPEIWQHCATQRDDQAEVFVYRCFDDSVLAARQMTAEPIVICPRTDPCIEQESLPDLPALMTHALAKTADIAVFDTSRPADFKM